MCCFFFLFSFLPCQQLSGVATFSNGSVAEVRINLRFDVEDENDNPPVFVLAPPATVYESSPAGKKNVVFCHQHSKY